MSSYTLREMNNPAVWSIINILKQIQKGRHFADDYLNWFFFNENVWIVIKITPKFVSKVPINNKPTLVQIMSLI